MSKSVALIAVHGMGETPENYDAEMKERVQKKLGPLQDNVDFRKVNYQHILQPNELKIWENVSNMAVVDQTRLRKFVLFGFGDAAGLENGKEETGSVYEQAQSEIASTLLDAYRQNANPNLKVVFLSHSLGCHVLSSYIYDAQKAAKARNGGHSPKAGVWKDIDAWAAAKGTALSKEEKQFLAAGSCMAWITTGCNIPIFVAAHAEIVPISSPMPGLFKWLNFYDRDDVLGWPLQPLSEAYGKLVKDVEINAGQGLFDLVAKSWNPWSHTTYWTDNDVLDPVANTLRQLAG